MAKGIYADPGRHFSTHGHTRKYKKSPTYVSWENMKARCFNESNPAHAHYKKLGITVCDRWINGDGNQSGFECFLSDMGDRPSLSYSIDRHPNNIGNYEPENCRWATKREQANNRITNKLVVYKGRTFTMAELARETGVSKELLRGRIQRCGWPVDAAVEIPLCRGSRTIKQTFSHVSAGLANG